nr:helix-turn-helix transcriptional regulator [uncultured Sediminibacterium sp.]
MLKSKIDWYVISQIRTIRLDKGMSQEELAIHLNLSRGFIGHIESPNFIAKYNLEQLNLIAKLFKCSPRNFLPENPL